MRYLGLALLGLVYLGIATVSNGSLLAGVEHTRVWIETYRPLSYIVILVAVFSSLFSLKIICTWPKRQEPQDPMAKYRHPQDVLED